MRFLYVANHGQPGTADDEGAIAHALRGLGHEVDPLRQERGRVAYRAAAGADVVLFHKWDDADSLAYLGGKTRRVFWYFDLVTFPDPLLEGRNKARLEWMARVLPHADLGFCTDGDWAARDATGKLVWLPQGADERVAGRGTYRPELACDVLFVGTRRGGTLRQSFVDEMKSAYGERFRHVEKNLYGRQLADQVASAKVVVAPDGPVTHAYWSNRVYVTLGYGGFLLHPWCVRLAGQYEDRQEVVFYRSRSHLQDLICAYLTTYDGPKLRREVSEAGLARTLKEHTYRRRCEEMVRVIKERLP